MSDKLNAQLVRDTMRDCLFSDVSPTGGNQIVEVPANAIEVEGVIVRYMFNPEGVERNRKVISDMLDELPENFHEKAGGGWSFLQAAMDRHGDHWAEHPTIDSLFCLGQAIGRVKYLLPRAVWAALPGSMPYLVVLEKDNG